MRLHFCFTVRKDAIYNLFEVSRNKFLNNKIAPRNLGPKIQCILKVKEKLSKVLKFQYSILNV